MSAARIPEGLVSALAFAERGLRVIPTHSVDAAGRCTCGQADCRWIGKHPRTAHGLNDATSEPTQIRAWWQRWPDANVAIATGGGLFVLDVDPRNGGDETLAGWVAQFGPLPVTPIVDTGGGGQHYYFESDRPIRRAKLGDGVDVKCDGGYVIAPPSRHQSGRCYAWREGRSLDDVPRAPLPAWVVSLLETPQKSASHTAREPHGHAVNHERNNYLTSFAGKLRRQGQDHADILRAIQAENLAVCKPPLESNEVEKIARSVSQYLTPSQQTDKALAALAALCADADAAQVESALETVGACAAQLSELGRQVLRDKASRILRDRGCRSAARLVDAALESSRPTTASPAAPEAGSALQLENPPPWDSPVTTAEILVELESAIGKFLVLPRHAAAAIALWVLHSHAFDAAQISARLAVISPTKRCGKSTLLKLLEALTSRSLLCVNVTASVVFRTIEKYRPTLLVDEADTFLKEREELRGILNAGHDRATACVPRCQGDDFEPRLFSVWAPAAIAAIGRLPDTLMDRSIVIEMRRRAPNETVMPFRRLEREALRDVKRRCVRWGLDHIKALRDARPIAPKGLSDRAADNWEALFAIADLAGDAMAAHARTVAVELSKRGGSEDDDDAPPRELLLADIRSAFEERQCDRFRTKELLEALHRLEERPWKEFRHGRELSANQLCRMLKSFGVASRCIRVGNDPHDVGRGYMVTDFAEAFARYLPSGNVTSVTSAISQEKLSKSQTLQNLVVALPKSTKTTCDFANVTDVTFRSRPSAPDPYEEEERRAIEEEGRGDGAAPKSPSAACQADHANFENVTSVTCANSQVKLATLETPQGPNVTSSKLPEKLCDFANVTLVTAPDPPLSPKQYPDERLDDEAKGDR